MVPTPPPQPAFRLADSGSAASTAAALACVRATFGGSPPDPHFDGAVDAVDCFPAWLAGGIIVGLSSVFWVGLLTIIGWII